MSFIVVKEYLPGAPSRTIARDQIDIGWGMGNDVQLTDRTIGPESTSLRITRDRDIFLLEGLSGRATLRQAEILPNTLVSDGDSIDLPPFQIDLSRSGVSLKLTIRRVERKGPPVLELESFKPPRRMPSPYVIGAALSIVLLGILGFATRPALMAPGALSDFHARVSCADCHAPLKAVANQACQSCHPAQMPETAPPGRFAGVTSLHMGRPGPACTACHQEHEGASSRLRPALLSRCQECHGFASVGQTRVSLKPHPVASSSAHQGYVTFSHENHLRQTPVGDPTRRMDCADCHRERDGFQTNFNRDCLSCHRDQLKVERTVFLPHGVALQPGQEALAEKDRCGMCHQTDGLKVRPIDAGGDWKTTFKHGPHRERIPEIACAACHPMRAADSFDVARLPSLELCTRCHNDTAGNNCTECHVYHRGRSPETLTTRIHPASP